MCDIGRFDYHWIESDARLTTPLVRQESGTQAESTWGGALARVGETLLPVVKDDAAALRVLVSAHASHEELFAIRQFVTRIPGASLESAAAVSWQSSVKVQPAATKFKVPPVDAPTWPARARWASACRMGPRPRAISAASARRSSRAR